MSSRRDGLTPEGLLRAEGLSSASTGAGGAPRNGAGATSLVMGILSIPLAVLLPLPGLVMGIVAVVSGTVGRRRAKAGLATNASSALAGALAGALGIVIAGFLLVSAAVFMATHPRQVAAYDHCMVHATSPTQRNACRRLLSANTVKRG